jgi:rRNA-processing protein FCF1
MASDWVRGDNKRRIVLLDTSAIFMIFEHSIRIQDELDRLLGLYEIKIIQDVYDEIYSLYISGTGKQQVLAKTALSFIKKFSIISNTSKKTVDDTLFHTALSLSAIVVTNDRNLRMKLLDHGIDTICLRGKNHLMMC